MNELTKLLLENQDLSYREFHSKLIPDNTHPIIGVRVPVIKSIAKSALKNLPTQTLDFISETHTFYDEFMLHALIINTLFLDVNKTFIEVEKFLPQVDNWAVCDSFVSSLKIINKHPEFVLEKVKDYLKSSRPYTVRFGVVVLLNYFLDKNFSEEVLSLVSERCGEHFYVDMAIAWLFSVALVKQYDFALPYLLNDKLTKFVHNKAIQKAIESYRIDKDTKEYLKTLKRKA
ncbi:MAG: DNA alkylation repair protein [Clostridiales bacterium]|nr:DNA alkylation repair protein [Clostridiales bacterium]